MSAKPTKKAARQSDRPSGGTPAAPSPIAAGTDTATAAAETSWLDSNDPKKQMWGKIIFAGIWVYVAALWLLALDQTFNWGIFGPKVPPLP